MRRIHFFEFNQLNAMQFSVRFIIALTILTALTIVAIDKHIKTHLRAEEVSQMREALKTQRESVRAKRINQESLERSVRLLETELAGVDAKIADLKVARNNAIEAFEQMQSRMSPFDITDAESVSLKKIKTTSKTHIGEHILQWRVYIPDEECVYLMFGVREWSDENWNRRTRLPQPITKKTEFLRTSNFEHSGPFEMKLAPGAHTIHVNWTEDVSPGRFQMQVKLDEKVVYESLYDGLVNNAQIHSFRNERQQDLGPKTSLPVLLTLYPSHGNVFRNGKPILGGRKNLTAPKVRFWLWLARETYEYDSLSGGVDAKN